MGPVSPLWWKINDKKGERKVLGGSWTRMGWWGWESPSHCLIHAYQRHNVTVIQFVLGQKPSRTYLTVTGLICLFSRPLRPPCIKGVFLHSSPGLDDGTLIRCDCMIMKRRNAMSKQLTQHKTAKAGKIPNQLKMSQGSPWGWITVCGQISSPQRCQPQGCCSSLVCLVASTPILLFFGLIPVYVNTIWVRKIKNDIRSLQTAHMI